MERRTLLYWIVLAMLLVALGVVGVLVLRKRAAPPVYVPVGGVTDTKKTPPPESKPLESYVPAPAFKAGDAPVVTISSDEEGGEPEQP
jgi:hypothetical protein